MIFDFQITPASSTKLVIAELHATPSFTFYLTGSRYLAQQGLRGVDDCADWDFFVDNTGGICSYLRSLGFSRLTTPEVYQDVNILWVYRNNQVAPWIDVQVVRNVALKLQIQAIFSEIFAKITSKELTRELWNALYQFHA